jgi:hypothetical protein
VTFSKRKGELLKKASELHLLSGSHVAVVIFSQKLDANPNPLLSPRRRVRVAEAPPPPGAGAATCSRWAPRPWTT